MKRYILSPEEFYWSGFLIDLNIEDTLPLFQGARLTFYPNISETVHEAWETARTIVTCDEARFVRQILDHSKRDSRENCQDCWGLLIVPDAKLTRKQLIPKMTNGVTLNGSAISWKPIGFANLCVSLLSDGSVGVRRFRRCMRCERNSAIRETWYTSLPEIRTRDAGKRR